MYSIKPLPEFTVWLDGLTDESVRGVIAARIKRLALGLMGDVEPVGGGVSELRVHIGAGWRLQAHPESRHQESQNLGFSIILT